MQRAELLADMRVRLQSEFGERLKGVVLYGSQARDEAEPASDIDLLVLLDEPLRLGRDLQRIVDALYPVQLQVDGPIHALPVATRVFEAGEFALYRNARREGKRL